MATIQISTVIIIFLLIMTFASLPLWSLDKLKKNPVFCQLGRRGKPDLEYSSMFWAKTGKRVLDLSKSSYSFSAKDINHPGAQLPFSYTC